MKITVSEMFYKIRKVYTIKLSVVLRWTDHHPFPCDHKILYA